ncbi:hypothetical protein MD484_g6363, partial [Candolleomyces efflorescens]
MDLHSFLDIDNAFVKSGGLPSSSASSHFGDPISAHFAKHLPASNGASTLGDVAVDLWPADTGYRLPESWSQTIESLLSIKVAPPLLAENAPETLPLGQRPSPVAEQAEENRNSRMPSPFRSLFESIPKPPVSSPLPQPQFVALADLSLPHASIPGTGLRVYPAPVSPSPPPVDVPAPTKLTSSSATGLSGWQPEKESEEVLLPGASLFNLKPPFPRPSAVRPSTKSKSSFESSASPISVPSRRKTRNKYTPIPSSVYGDVVGSDDGGDEEDDDDDDVYQPSSSPARSETKSRSPSPGYDLSYPGTYRTIAQGVTVERHSSRRKGKAKGSAALALAVVTQLSKIQQHTGSRISVEDAALASLFDEDNDDVDFEERLRAVQPIRKRKNSAIPLPVPVPHLIKKSRGRKVPYVSPQPETLPDPTKVDLAQTRMISSSSEASTSIRGQSTDESLSQRSTDGQPVRSARSTRGRKTSTPYSLAEGGKRSYMCEVPGCGKCFVRGEHLKRHVRSIHTYDKPHPCPYSGCDKTFSRRDNLGQHVRIHLQA